MYVIVLLISFPLVPLQIPVTKTTPELERVISLVRLVEVFVLFVPVELPFKVVEKVLIPDANAQDTVTFAFFRYPVEVAVLLTEKEMVGAFGG